MHYLIARQHVILGFSQKTCNSPHHCHQQTLYLDHLLVFQTSLGENCTVLTRNGNGSYGTEERQRYNGTSQWHNGTAEWNNETATAEWQRSGGNQALLL